MNFLKPLEFLEKNISVTIKTINREYTNSSMAIKDFHVANIKNTINSWLDLPTTLTKPELPVYNEDVTQPSQLKQ